ncbi:cytochrome caa3 oxidase (subunit IV) [Planococcus antarcticus DSM 14505]|uniref:Cytochrome caa3 oxidase (Subunit IV) n=1 Tax=Planococcus antarcticus DSM 14505 TaxID=1185653 RepID=A0AA87IN08_9BACL|nr:cytochrome c oxidase subunit IVB [Planococcus antarcticus]EIM07820.1 cytochrome caa3 oxidase (subunit IV) [Planococcus antarcticus DSM 14505]
MSHDTHIYVRSQAEFEYAKKKRAEEMRGHLATFAIMIFLTLIAFTMVAAGFSVYLIVPIILLLAGIQVVLQLYYFMHLSGKGHGMVAFFLFCGIFVAFITILTFVTIIWW